MKTRNILPLTTQYAQLTLKLMADRLEELTKK